MIAYFKIKNFLSFKDEVTINFEATKDTKYEGYQTVKIAPNIRILRIAVVFGANASGKSNLISSIEFLKTFWFKDQPTKDEPTGAIPFIFSDETSKQPSELSMGFYINQKKYVYSLAINQNIVINEKLQTYPSRQPATIFERVTTNGISQISFNPKWIKINQNTKERISLNCLQNMSVFAAYNKTNIALKEIDDVINWAKTHFIHFKNDIKYTKHTVYNNKNKKATILNYLQRANCNITDIYAQQTENPQSDKEETTNTVLFEHCITNDKGKEERYKLPIDLESKGTIKIFDLAEIIDYSKENDSFLAIDGIEESLHPALVESIIEDFLKNREESQMLITTHYDGLLDSDGLLRNDSIWFTNKKKDGATELYSLVEFKGINRLTSLRNAYRNGKFGAIP
jgi:AAA15 family ATPase/GTPase